MTERGAKGSGSGGFEADGELGVKEGEVCLFLGRTVEKTKMLPPSAGRAHTEWWSLSLDRVTVVHSDQQKSVLIRSFIICWRKFSVTKSDDLFLWPICWHMKIAPLSRALIFFLPLFCYIYYSNGKAGCSLIGDAVTKVQPPRGGWATFQVPVNPESIILIL